MTLAQGKFPVPRITSFVPVGYWALISKIQNDLGTGQLSGTMDGKLLWYLAKIQDHGLDNDFDIGQVFGDMDTNFGTRQTSGNTDKDFDTRQISGTMDNDFDTGLKSLSGLGIKRKCGPPALAKKSFDCSIQSSALNWDFRPLWISLQSS